MKRLVAGVLAVALLTASCGGGKSSSNGTSSSNNPATGSPHPKSVAPIDPNIHKIQHVVMIMQENRSFDSYFGTYPGADGIPMQNGQPTVCNPNPQTGHCDAPYHDPNDVNGGGPHSNDNSNADVNGGKMDGFIGQAESSQSNCNPDDNNPLCRQGIGIDVMGWHDAREIPNYWSYAQNFVLQDHMFEPNASWSLPSHLFQVSEWSATCGKSGDPSSCTNEVQTPGKPPNPPKTEPAPDYAWTDLTYLLHANKVSWGYYVVAGTEPDCRNDASISCTPVKQNAKTPGIWNVLPYFETVKQDNELGNIQSVENFYTAARTGDLPAVSWISPSDPVSEHPPNSVAAGQSYVTSLVNAVMNGPDWDSTAIFVAWDDWGGFYDHVQPPSVDQNGYGMRVPGLLISPYAKKGMIDHQTLSFDAYAKFIEDDFLNGARLDPTTDGRPDPRPTVREDVSILGDLSQEFDFSQSPIPPMPLAPRPPPGPASQ